MFNKDGLLLRPSYKDDYVIQYAAELAFPEIIKWLGNTFCTDKEIISDLKKVITCFDGYEIAKNLDSMGWKTDRSLINIMDNDYIGTAIQKLTKKWVICLGIKQEIPLGTLVEIDTMHNQKGQIISYDEKYGTYGIRTSEQKSTARWIIPAENIKVLN
jgi:hypothetical protein